MAALTYTILALAHAGDHVASASTAVPLSICLKETCLALWHYHDFVDIENLDEVESSHSGQPQKLVLIESLESFDKYSDFDALAELVHAHRFR